MDTVKKILIVENEIGVRDNLRIILESNGYNVVLSSDGRQALAELEQSIPDIIVADIMMPNLNGIELYKIIKEKYTHTEIPFIFLTAKNDIKSIREGMSLGVEDYITKPFDMDDLLKSIGIRLAKKEKLDEPNKLLRNDIMKYVPHELRTPLVPILNLSEYLLSEIDSLEKNEIKEVINQINLAGHRLLNRVEKFLLFTELETLEKESGVFSVTAYIDEDFIAGIIYKSQILRTFLPLVDFSVSPASLKIHEYYLSILFKELIENAAKFSDRKNKIKVHGGKNNSGYCLEITNYGTGMTNEEIASINAFKQFNREIVNQEGNGLGLAIVRKIVDLFNGEIFFESGKDNHTTVKIFLPLVTQK
ncbi:MAG: response regulator [Ignavibacteriales bacterium]|nr:response regulator [Ignavibacteriales bacterium]